MFISQNNKLDAKPSGFRSGNSTKSALLSVTEVLRIAKADSNHQSSLCWICLLLLTLSIIRSSCPPSHYWTSLGFHFAGLNPISLVGLSRWPGEGRYPKHINWSLGFPRISGCLADISAWMKEHHLQLNLAKTELLVCPATPTLQHDFSIQLGSSTITSSALVRNLGVIFDDQLTFKEHIAKTARSCRFALHNIRKIRPFLTEHAAQLLVQALVMSRLDYCNALLAGFPSNTIKTLQMIQNAAARLVFNEPKKSPCYTSLCFLALATSSRH